MFRQICTIFLLTIALTACGDNKQTVVKKDTISPAIAQQLSQLDWVLDTDVSGRGAFVNVAIANPNHAEFLTQSMCVIVKDYRKGKLANAIVWYNGRRIGRRDCSTWKYKQG